MIRIIRPGRGAVSHLAGLDSLRQLPGNGPGRTVALAPIRGTVQQVKEGLAGD